MTAVHPTRSKRRRWDSVLLAAMAYPANLAFAGLAAFVLALPIVTWLAAMVAAGRALHRWSVDDDDRVLTNTFREFRLTWRRTLPVSVIATAIVTILLINLLFLGDQGTAIAYLFGMATIPVTVVFVLAVVMLPVAAARERDGSARDWLRLAGALAGRRPLASVVLAVIVIGFVLTCVLLPTIAPFFGLSLPVWLGLVTARPSRDPDRRVR